MTRRLKILTISQLYPSTAYPGSGPFVRDEVIELAKRHELRVVSPLRVPQRQPSLARDVLLTPRESIEDGIPIARPRILEPPFGGPVIGAWVWTLRLGRTVRRAYRDLDADLVHAHFAHPDGFVAARFALREGAPFVLTVRGSDVLLYGRRAATRRLLVKTLAQADAVIAVSEELAHRVQQLGVAPEVSWVIPGGVQYAPAMEQDFARRLVGIPEGERCIVWVGSFAPVKQPTDVVSAVCSLGVQAHGGKVHLVMIGDGPSWRSTADFLRRSFPEEAVRLIGRLPREEVWTWQCAADLLVNSSRSEGTPVSVLEALGAGTPVAAYPLSGVRAAVNAVDGGTIASGTTPQDLADAIRTELSTARDRTQIAKAARTHFEIARTAEAIEDVYTAVLERRG